MELAGQPALLYVLLEHQRTLDRFMPLRVLRYLLRVWERWRAGRFGEIGPGHAGRLASASAAELDAWALRVLGATSLDQVFAD